MGSRRRPWLSTIQPLAKHWRVFIETLERLSKTLACLPGDAGASFKNTPVFRVRVHAMPIPRHQSIVFDLAVGLRASALGEVFIAPLRVRQGEAVKSEIIGDVQLALEALFA